MAERELSLYELGKRDRVAYVSHEGMVWQQGPPDGADRLITEEVRQRYGVPSILFADVPVQLRLRCGVMVAPIGLADTETGPPGLFADALDRAHG